MHKLQYFLLNALNFNFFFIEILMNPKLFLVELTKHQHFSSLKRLFFSFNALKSLEGRALFTSCKTIGQIALLRASHQPIYSLLFQNYSTCVYLHKYCNSFIIILLISSLSDTHLNSLSFHHCSLFLSSQLSLSLISTLSQFITKPISFSFFFKISGFKDKDNDSSAEISRATD